MPDLRFAFSTESPEPSDDRVRVHVRGYDVSSGTEHERACNWLRARSHVELNGSLVVGDESVPAGVIRFSLAPLPHYRARERSLARNFGNHPGLRSVDGAIY
jgi:hypothetical protein